MKNKDERKSINRKKTLVEQLVNLCKGKDTLVISNIERIPAETFKRLRKELKKLNTDIKVIKAKLAKKVLEGLGIETSSIENFLQKPTALIISNLDVFALASLLEKSKEYSYLKPGMVVEKEIVIEPMTTDLPPTAVVELSKVLKVGVEKGKVVVKEKKIIKPGEIVDDALANALQKLEIKPLKIGLSVDVGIELKTGKIYKNVIVNKEEEIQKLISAHSRAMNLAIAISYPCKQTINVLLQKAAAYAKTLNLKI